MDPFYSIIPGLICALPLGLIPAFIAHRKGHNFWGWWLFGFLLFIIALPCSILISHNLRKFRRCSYCRSWIPRDATTCSICGKDLPVLVNNNQVDVLTKIIGIDR